MFETIENEDSLNLEEDVEPTETELALEAEREKTAKLEETNKRLFERATKAEEKAKAARQITRPTKESDDETVSRLEKLEKIELKRQFGFEHGLSPAETDIVFQFSQGKPTKETLEHPFIKAGLEAQRAEDRVNKNTPNPSSRSLSYQGKDFKDLSEEDRQKAFAEKMKGVKK